MTQQHRGSAAQSKALSQMEQLRSTTTASAFHSLRSPALQLLTHIKNQGTTHLIFTFFLFTSPFIYSPWVQGTLLFADQGQRLLHLIGGLTGLCRLWGQTGGRWEDSQGKGQIQTLWGTANSRGAAEFREGAQDCAATLVLPEPWPVGRAYIPYEAMPSLRPKRVLSSRMRATKPACASKHWFRP